MPTYEYVCEKCDHPFEKFQSMMDPALKVCPKELCAQKKWGRGRVKRVMGAGAGLIFKGSGFYITDYRSENYKATAKKESTAGSPAAAAESKAGAASSDKKPAAAKPESKPAKAAGKD